MKKWLLTIAVLLCALAVLMTGAWWVWRGFYSAVQFRAAMAASDYERAERLLAWGADPGPWREERSLDELTDALYEEDYPGARRLIALGADVDGRQVAFVGEGRLVEDTGLSQSSVRRAVRELRGAGVIKTSLGGVTRGHPHHCNEFELIG